MWSVQTDTVSLPPDVVHIWRIELDVNEARQEALWELLSGEEKDRADRFRFAADRRRFIAARGTLRKILAQYLSRDPAVIHFQYGPYGKPALARGELEFNLSHAKDLALLGVVRNYAVGVDLECVRRDLEFAEIAAHFFATDEVRALQQVPSDDRPLAFFNCWTRKEAFIKAMGSGLTFPLDRFEVSLKPKDVPRLIATHWNIEEVKEWSLYGLEPARGFVGAVAIRGKIQVIRHWRWPE